MTSNWRATALIAGILLAMLGLVAWAVGKWFYGRAPVAQEIPHSSPTSPFLNTRSAVKYVGDSTCAGCHADQAETYRQHPMGHLEAHEMAIFWEKSRGKFALSLLAR